MRAGGEHGGLELRFYGADDAVHLLDKLVELVASSAEGRGEVHDVAHDAAEDAFLVHLGGGELRQVGLGGELLLRGAVPDELEGAEEAEATPDVADDGVLVHGLQLVEEVLAEAGGIADKVLTLHDLEVGEAGGAGGRVAAEGDEVPEGGGLVADEGVGDILARDGSADGQVAAGEGFGDGEDVGLDAPVLRREPLAGAAEAGDDLIADEEDAVPVADLADGGPVLGVRERGRRRRWRWAPQ